MFTRSTILLLSALFLGCFPAEATRAQEPKPATASAASSDADATCEPISQADVDSGMLKELANPEEAARRVAALMKIEGDPAFGEYLAGDCASCHNIEAAANGLAGRIEGMSHQHFYQAMVEYRLGLRSDPVMQGLARVLGTPELTALASFLEQAGLHN